MASWAKSEDEEEGGPRVAERIASRILVSSFFATISAAFPRGARMNGTCPVDVDVSRRMEKREELPTHGGDRAK